VGLRGEGSRHDLWAGAWGWPVSTLALDPSSGAAEGRPGTLVRNADLALLALALPVFLLTGLPIAGYAAAAAGWLAQRALQHATQTRLARAEERTTALRLVGGSIVLRLWVVTLAVLLVGLLVDDEAGLAAAVLAAALVTAALAGEAAARLGSSRGEGA
jgi:hypothetical protein